MFSLYAKSRLHSFGEIINKYRFWWESPGHGPQRLGLQRAQPAQLAAGCTGASTWTSTAGSCA